jgi:hypothetical protein
MEDARGTARSAARAGVAVLGAAALLAGCGSDNGYENRDRPPAPINVTASISSRGIAISPANIGGGPIVLIVTNQSDTAQRVTFESEPSATEPGIQQETPAIQPTDTAEIKVDVDEGRYRLKVADDDISPGTVIVGAQRASAQNDLLQP